MYSSTLIQKENRPEIDILVKTKIKLTSIKTSHEKISESAIYI